MAWLCYYVSLMGEQPKNNQYATQRYIMYIDQVLKDDAKQDSMTEIALI